LDASGSLPSAAPVERLGERDGRILEEPPADTLRGTEHPTRQAGTAASLPFASIEAVALEARVELAPGKSEQLRRDRLVALSLSHRFLG
jgi:hypothetical protein